MPTIASHSRILYEGEDIFIFKTTELPTPQNIPLFILHLSPLLVKQI